MNETIKRWNELLLSITDEEKAWIHEDEIAAKTFYELGDFITKDLNGMPDEGCVAFLENLLSSVRVTIDEKRKENDSGEDR